MSPESRFDFVKLPKTDLHVHLEGTLEPEMLFRLAGRSRFFHRSPQKLKRLSGAYSASVRLP